MRGQFVSWDIPSASGWIDGEDGRRYAAYADSLRQSGTPWVGARVEFTPAGDVAENLVLLADAPRTATGTADQNDWTKLFFSPEGRIPRSRFWAAWGIQLGAGIVLGWIPLIGFIVSLVLIWTNIAVNTKRLHDMGRSGWWQIAPWVATILGVIGLIAFGVAGAFGDGTARNDTAIGVTVLVLVGVYVLVNLGFLLWVGVTPSDPDENRFGPPPGQNIASSFD